MSAGAVACVLVCVSASLSNHLWWYISSFIIRNKPNIKYLTKQTLGARSWVFTKLALIHLGCICKPLWLLVLLHHCMQSSSTQGSELISIRTHVSVVISTCWDAREGEDLIHRLHSRDCCYLYSPSLSFLQNSDMCMSLPVFHTHANSHTLEFSVFLCWPLVQCVAHTERVWCKKNINCTL